MSGCSHQNVWRCCGSCTSHRSRVEATAVTHGPCCVYGQAGLLCKCIRAERKRLTENDKEVMCAGRRQRVGESVIYGARNTDRSVCEAGGGMGFCLELRAVCLKVRASVFLILLRHEDIYSPPCVNKLEEC